MTMTVPTSPLSLERQAPSVLNAWTAAQPLDGPRETWRAWWERRPGDPSATTAQELLGAVLPQRAPGGEKKKSRPLSGCCLSCAPPLLQDG